MEDSEENPEASVQQTLEELQQNMQERHDNDKDLLHRIEMDQKNTMSELRVLRGEIDAKLRQLNKAVSQSKIRSGSDSATLASSSGADELDD